MGLFAVVDLLTLARNHTEAEDSMFYLVRIRDGPSRALWVPYHMAWHWLGRLAYVVGQHLRYHHGPLVPVQVMDAFFGATAVALLWALLRISPCFDPAGGRSRCSVSPTALPFSGTTPTSCS